MTPELKTACEVVFQEHKTSPSPINWNKDAFRGRLPFGLSAKAKETLVEKNVIYSPNPAKKIFTLLNPLAASATTVEEAEELVKKKKVSSRVTRIVKEQPVAVMTNNDVSYADKPGPVYINITTKAKAITIPETKWYARPLFYYVVWPACAAVGGALIAFLMGFVSDLFLK
jgi:hypothetical protein